MHRGLVLVISLNVWNLTFLLESCELLVYLRSLCLDDFRHGVVVAPWPEVNFVDHLRRKFFAAQKSTNIKMV